MQSGQVILNQAFQATIVDVPERKPLDPIILDLDESFINNLLIIAKPRDLEEEEYKQREQKVLQTH